MNTFILILLFPLTLTPSHAEFPCPSNLSPVRCACHLTLPRDSHCLSLFPPRGARSDPCAAFTKRGTVNARALLEALHHTLHCAGLNEIGADRMLKTLSPEEEQAILRRIRDMVVMVLRQLNMGRSVEPGFRMVVKDDARGRLKVARLVAYNGFKE